MNLQANERVNRFLGYLSFQVSKYIHGNGVKVSLNWKILSWGNRSSAKRLAVESRDGKINRRWRYDRITNIWIPYMIHTYPGCS
jgi:hypothetical protein